MSIGDPIPVPARRPLRLVRLAALAGGITLGLFGAWFALERVPMAVAWRAGLGFLVALEAAYGLALVGSAVAAPVLTRSILRARRRGLSRPRAARGLLLAASVLLALAMAEAASAAVRALRGRSEAVPVGGLDRDDDRPRLPADPSDIALPTDFPDPIGGGDGVVDVVIVGESSAAGVPYNFWLSPGRLLAWRLGEEVPGREFRLHTIAESGDNLAGQHEKLAARLTRRPDLLVVYCGHNEFSTRFAWSRDLPHYRDADEPTAWGRFAAWAGRASPLCGLIREAAEKCRVRIPPPREGNRALVDVPAFTPEERDRLVDDFGRRLEAIVSWADRVGALTVLVISPANEADFEPNRSYLPAGMSRDARRAFERAFLAARRLEDSDPDASLSRYRELLAEQPGFAELHFRAARLLERAGDADAAARHDLLALECDGLPMRCPAPFRDAYREIAARHGCFLVDGRAEMRAVAAGGRLGDDVFHDGMHPSLRGQIALIQAILRELRDRRAFGWPEASPALAIDPAEVEREFGLSPAVWSRICHWGIMFYDLTAPARYDSSARRAKQDAFGKAADRIDAGAEPGSVGLPNIGRPRPVPALPAAPSPDPAEGDDRAGPRYPW